MIVKVCSSLLRLTIGVSMSIIVVAPAFAQVAPKYTPEQKNKYRRMSADLHTGAAFWAGVAGIGALFAATGVGLGVAIGGGINATYYEMLSSEYNKCAGDPPDPNYRTIQAPLVHTFQTITPGSGVTPAEAAALNALLANLAQVNALNDAMITSINRAQGAELDRQFGWVRRQARAAKTYA